MKTGELLIDIIKSGVVTLVSAKMTKAIGEKDISDIISCCGYGIIGVDTILLISPIVEALEKFFKHMSDLGDGASEFLKDLMSFFAKFKMMK